MPPADDEKVVPLVPPAAQGGRQFAPLQRFSAACQILLDMDGRLDIATALVFAVVAAAGGPISGREIGRKAGTSTSATNRHLLTLEAGSGAVGQRAKGLGLIKSAQSPFDGRAKLYSLTPTGERLAHRLANTLAPN